MIGSSSARTDAAVLDLLDAARLAPGQVDAQLLRGPEHLVVRLAHLQGDAVDGVHLDVEAQRLELHTPCGLAIPTRGLIRLIDPGDLERLGGGVAAFAAALRRAAQSAGLRWPTAPPGTGDGLDK